MTRTKADIQDKARRMDSERVHIQFSPMKSGYRATTSPTTSLKTEPVAQRAKRLKRWKSGREMIRGLAVEGSQESSYEF